MQDLTDAHDVKVKDVLTYVCCRGHVSRILEGKKKGNKKRCLYIASGETRIAETRPVALLRHIRKTRVVSGISRIGHRGWS